jgi:hypothetical protein
MKRALTAVAVGGLLAFAVPQGALADHSSEGQEATAPESTPAEPEQGPPAGHPYGDSEQHDDDEATLLF